MAEKSEPSSKYCRRRRRIEKLLKINNLLIRSNNLPQNPLLSAPIQYNF